jgi:hypothetical protein
MAASYWFSAPVGGNQPYIYASDQQNTQPAISVNLDDVFQATPTGNLPAAPPYFSLAKATTPFAYQINVDPSVWTFDASPIRAPVRQAFDAFLEALDTQGLKPGRLDLIRGWLAQALPQTFAESLYFRYGFDPAARCVELSPGMRLRIDFQAHQAVDPGSTLLNGFVGSGRSYVEIAQVTGAKGGLVTAFDPFLAQLQGMSAQSSPGAGGAVDLQGAEFQQPYWRLIYPQGYTSSGGTGYLGTQQNPVLIGAPTRTALEAATTQYGKDGTVPGPAVAVWFRGRAAPVPEIPLLTQGEPSWCTLGTTLRGLLSGFGPQPWIGGTVTVPSQFCTRLFTQLGGTGGKAVIWKLLTYAAVHLDSSYYTYGPTLDSLDMPLVGGDSVAFPLTG